MATAKQALQRVTVLCKT